LALIVQAGALFLTPTDSVLSVRLAKPWFADAMLPTSCQESFMRRADRLFQIVLLLSGHRAVTARALAEKLEVSERTIYRDMADLMAGGLPVDGEAGVGYLLRSGARLPPLTFDAEELAALALGSRMVHGWADRALGQAAERALLKIQSVLPADRRERLDQQALLVPEFHIPPAQRAPLGALRRAIDEHRKVRFAYTRADGTATRRVVRPLGLVFWGGGWTLGGWCELRDGFRTFRLDRMETPEVLGETFIADEGKSLADYLRAAGA
jgi:predicted DNA-binding transcriptional regulator YafY